MSFWALVGLGPNDVEITSLIFSTKEAAVQFITPLLGEPSERTDRRSKATQLFWEAPDWEKEKDDEYEWLPDARITKFYNHYYGGCGECWGFILKEVQEGQPFVGFDLD